MTRPRTPHFPKITGTAEKQDEIEYLRNILNSVPGTYLASLINLDVIHWFENQIAKDLPPDLWAEYTYEKRCHVQCNSEINRLKVDLYANAQVENYQRNEIAQQEIIITQLRREISSLKSQLEQINQFDPVI